MSKEQSKPDHFDRLFAEAVVREDARNFSPWANLWARAGRDVVTPKDAFSSNDITQDAADLARTNDQNAHPDDAPTLAAFLKSSQPMGNTGAPRVSGTPIMDPSLLVSNQNDSSKVSPTKQAIALLGGIGLLIAAIVVWGQPG